MDIARSDIKKLKRKRYLVIGGSIAVGLLTAAAGVASLDSAAPTVERSAVWIDTVKHGEFVREVRGPGTLVPRDIRWITAATDARIERIVIKPGAKVEADTVILELTSPEVEERLQTASSAVAAAEADLSARRTTLESQRLDQKAILAAAEAEYESARLQAEAEKDLTDRGIIPKVQYQRSELTTTRLRVRFEIERERSVKLSQNLEAQLSADQSRLAQLRGTLDLRQRQADALHVRAGIAGILQQVPVEEGQQVTSGANLARVARQDVLVAQLRIPETQAKDLLIGQGATVDLRSVKIAGKVARVDPAVRNGTVQVDVDLLGELPAAARPDLSVDGTVEIERIADATYVGRPALGQAGSEVHLFRLSSNDAEATRVPVRLGRSSVNLVEVSQGLQPGDRVILSDTSAWDSSDRIRLR